MADSAVKPAAGRRGRMGPPPLQLRFQTRQQQPRKQDADNRWTKSGAFVIPGSGAKVTQNGVVHTVVASETSSGSSSEAGGHGYTTVSTESDITMDRLRLLHHLGAGASGDVRLAEDTERGTMYALKRITQAGHSANLTLKVWEEETKRMFLSSANLVTTHQAFMGTSSTLLLVQEYMDWGSLEQLLGRCSEKGVKIPERLISFLAREMLKGLCDLGGRYMHRDMKPGNVLLNTLGECKLADFGICSEVSTVGKSTFVGTVTYMSPERVEGLRYGTRADTWAVGLMVAEMVLGRYPFDNGNIVQVLAQITKDDPVALPDSVPPYIASFVHNLLKRDPLQRPSSAGALDLPFITKHLATTSADFAAWLMEEYPSRAPAAHRAAPLGNSP
eukprot:TRINITY_DN19815_c0_g1_i1.p1 TRINITY_DN19815_c0_g1~~TRINITY_DN19815_c0_g1_i1.p1  ORF type:complete len:402 (+),score=87.51 TRINITY_DN19815_c0_g1_i1:44-1207(+)